MPQRFLHEDVSGDLPVLRAAGLAGKESLTGMRASWYTIRRQADAAATPMVYPLAWAHMSHTNRGISGCRIASSKQMMETRRRNSPALSFMSCNAHLKTVVKVPPVDSSKSFQESHMHRRRRVLRLAQSRCKRAGFEAVPK